MILARLPKINCANLKCGMAFRLVKLQSEYKSLVVNHRDHKTVAKQILKCLKLIRKLIWYVLSNKTPIGINTGGEPTVRTAFIPLVRLAEFKPIPTSRLDYVRKIA